MLRKIFVATLALLVSSPAFAQQGAQLSAGQIWANATASQRTGKATNLSDLLDRAICGTTGAVVSRGVSLWQCVTNIPITSGGTGATTAANARTNLGLGTMATQAASAVAITGGTITGMSNPLVGSDVANKTYVDNTSSAIVIQLPSRLATAAVLPNSPTYSNGASGVGATLTAGSNTTLTVDGSVVNASDQVLVKNQASAFQNGLYSLTTAGGGVPWVLTRIVSFDQTAEMLKGSYSFVNAGSVNAFTSWTLNAAVTTVGTDPLNWTLFTSQPSNIVQSINGTAGVFTTTQPITNSGTVLLLNAAVNPGGRLTLVSGFPVVPSGSTTAATQMLYTPYFGNLVPIYDGTNFIPTAFAELSNVNANSAVGNAGPAAVAASSCYDYFVWNNSGTVTLTRGTVWTNITTRSAGTALVRTNGIYLNSLSITNGPGASRGTYVGTACSNAGSTFDYIFGGAGTAAVFSVWNMYNRRLVVASVMDSASSWIVPTNTATFRVLNNNNANRITWVSGLAEDGIEMKAYIVFNNDLLNGGSCDFGAQLDTTTGTVTNLDRLAYGPSSGGSVPINRNYTAQLGQHFLSILESNLAGGNTCTVFGNAAASHNWSSFDLAIYQ